MENYNTVIKGKGISFWPVRAFNFMFDNSVLTIMYLVLDVNYLLTVVKLIDTL
jgi:hypothetical protein